MYINILNAVMDFVYPEKCILCGKIDRFHGVCICPLCEKEAVKIEPPYCPKCGKHIDTGQELCRDCQGRVLRFDMSGALWPYEGKFARSVLDLKFNKKLENGKTLGALCASSITQKGLGNDIDIIIPVPLHRQKMRKRGYNQAELIAKEIGLRLNIPVRADLIIRLKKTAPQMDLNLEQRLANIIDSMGIPHPEEIAGKRILLIDDIFTTGATLNECSAELKKCGAEKVNCFCVCISYNSTLKKRNEKF